MKFFTTLVLVILNAAAVLSQQVKCYNCVVTVNTADYVECKTLSSVKEITCPAGSVGCAVIRDHPKGQFAEFRRECIEKKFATRTNNTYCETKKKTDTDPKYFSCITCQGNGCNKILLK
ncbi:uncharacterized protein LOC123319534 [Coccinella septempunctata]|uniref:uncharacterized protein LOC123319534 n=1 Tax=Coccinella septempunctata TaxID=41139 RepID=UPI001D08E4C6|nr:uncharacterized protein LOC123319534 [Coccinella septempunctata]